MFAIKKIQSKNLYVSRLLFTKMSCRQRRHNNFIIQIIDISESLLHNHLWRFYDIKNFPSIQFILQNEVQLDGGGALYIRFEFQGSFKALRKY